MSRPPVAIMAGGLGTRLRPASGDQPKCMVEVGGAPFLAHLINLYQGQGFEHVHLCLGYGSDQVVDEVVSGRMGVTYSIEVDPLGTAGCIRNALDYLGDTIVVAMGDSYTPEPIVPHYERWCASGTSGAMFVLENHDALVPSNVEVTGDLVTRYQKHESPVGWRFVDYGISLFQRAVIESLPPGFVDFGVVFQELADNGELLACVASEVFWEIGTPDSLARARVAVREGSLRLV